MLYLLMIAALVAIDQGSKYLAEIYLKPLSSYPLIADIFHLTYGRNTGAAFSILQGKQIFLIIFTIVILSGITFYLFKNIKKSNRLLNFSLAFILGGALGNLIDRIRLSYVVDMFDFTLISFPIFNSADIFVVSGTIGLSCTLLFSKHSKNGLEGAC